MKSAGSLPRGALPDATDLFPDDLVRVYLIIAPELGLPAERALGERLRDAAKTWKGFEDSRAAMAELAKTHRLIAMTNAQRWAFEYFSKELGNPFYAAFTADDTGTEKPDPAFFEKVLPLLRAKARRRTTSCMWHKASTTISAFPGSSA